MITDKQYERYIKTRVGKLHKIGNIHDAVKTLRELGWTDFKQMSDAIDNDHGLGMVRIGHTYYYTDF